MDHPAWAEVDLAAIHHNLTSIKQFVGESVDVMAVVKANAYGHGLTQIALAAQRAGIEWFGVATVSEGVALRTVAAESNIVVLTPSLPNLAEDIAAHSLIPLVSELELVRNLNDAATRLDTHVSVHLDVNTGMGRSGVQAEDATQLAREISRFDHVRLAGLTTHFPSAESDGRFTGMQIAQIEDLAEELGDKSLRIHAANSAGTCIYRRGWFHMVRVGLLVYGIRPKMHETVPCPDTRPALSLKARVALVKELPKGCSISYDRTVVLKRRSRVATIPIGYGDGYPRELSNKGHVLIAGKRARILGRVCMDVIVADVTDIPAVTAGQKVTLIGEDGQEKISVDDIARLIGTTPHDVTTRLLPRLPRVYLNDGTAETDDSPQNDNSD